MPEENTVITANAIALKPLVFSFFFQAEDGIRDVAVTGVQTCALPISRYGVSTRSAIGSISSQRTPERLIPVSISRWNAPPPAPRAIQAWMLAPSPSAGVKIGRASCRERV